MHARIGWQNLRTSEFLDDGDYMLITGTDFEEGRINFQHAIMLKKKDMIKIATFKLAMEVSLLQRMERLGKSRMYRD
jgi:type I restriction enzyme S subunit